jgi:hypothetical protein
MDGGAHGAVMQVTRRRRLDCTRRKETQVELGLLIGSRPKASGPAQVENGGLLQGFWAKLHMGCRNKVFEFIQDLGFKTKDSNTFKLNLN